MRELERSGVRLGVTSDSLREFLARGEYTMEVDPIVSLQTMLQMAPLLHGFYQEMQWTVIRAVGEDFFVTSDNPVVKGDPGYRGGMRGIGLYSPTIEVRFPISKAACLVITHDHDREARWHELTNSGREAEAQDLRRTVPSTAFRKATTGTVANINATTIRYATRFVFSPGRDDRRIPDLLRGDSQAVRIHMG